MFRIDKSFVDSININKEFIIITPKEVFENVPEPVAEEKCQLVTEQEILQKANAQAEQIIREAEIDAKDIKKKAWQEGYREGSQQAQEEMDAQISEQTEDAKRIFSRLEAYKQDLYQDLLDSVLGLSYNIAEKIINIHLKKDDTLYKEIAKAAIQALNSSSKFALHVSRAEYDRFFREGGQWLREDIGCAPFEVICDPYMAEGGCIVESDEGVVSAGVSEQLSKLKRIIDERTEPDEEL